MSLEWKNAEPTPEYTAPTDHWPDRVRDMLGRMDAPQSLWTPTLAKPTDTNCKTQHVRKQVI
ncbi:hypothetical protein ATR1_075d0050 [Acetobacter tropicalis]|uniref:Uncharacterized protein n=1 Tax=Acetobacter tropicalis TaxID=104102 RepID=A0A511FK70_9PROT|nr:hypothetical protein ATR1_075d0050 [Acetobacter tropicalis]GEL48974.1 hypothetical protein ATR01nite_00490 [Acetobacter tropicalis]